MNHSEQEPYFEGSQAFEHLVHESLNFCLLCSDTFFRIHPSQFVRTVCLDCWPIRELYFKVYPNQHPKFHQFIKVLLSIHCEFCEEKKTLVQHAAANYENASHLCTPCHQLLLTHAQDDDDDDDDGDIDSP